MKGEGFSSVFWVLLLLSSLLVTNPAFAEYPEHKIRLVVGYTPGGSTDMIARTVAQHVNPYLAGKVYVENVPGAGTAIAAREVSKAAPDGYTLLLFTTTNVIGQHIKKDYPPYDLFDPICVVNVDAPVMSVKADSRFKTLEDVVSYAKVHPGEVSITSVGVGTIDHVATEALMSATGTKLTVVPNKGTAESLLAVAGGNVDVALSTFAELAPLIEGKKLRPLAHFGNKRSAYFPDVPTVKESGYNVFIAIFRGVSVRKGTPEGIKRALDEAFRKGMQSEEFKRTFNNIRFEPSHLGPIEATAFVNEMGAFYKDMAAKMGLKPE